MFLSNASLRRPIAASTVVFALIIMGLFVLNKIGIDFLPRMDFPFISIVTVYPGAGPNEVETLISKKIEDAVSEVDGIKYVQSVSMENISQVFIEFELGTDIDISAMDVREKVDLILSDLPEDAEAPVLLKIDPNAKPVMNLVLYGGQDLRKLYDVADTRLRDRLSQLPGMASVEIIGGKKREIQILVNSGRLASQGLSILDIVNALGRENLDLPSGHITEGSLEYTIRLAGEFEDLAEIGLVEIPLRDGSRVRLTDLAEIVDAAEEQRILSRFNSKECVTLRLKKRSDANTVAVVDAVYGRLEELRIFLPPGIKLDVASDDSSFVRFSVKDVEQNMLIGILLTVVILYLFLHNFRATLVAGVAIPISIVSTLIPIYFAGFTLNMMSLMALALSVGILVMNALVVLENIYRHLDRGETPSDAARFGTGEIALAVFGSAMTNIVVFLPIAFMKGIVGQFFYQFGVTVAFATVVSLLVSFTVTPILAARFCKQVENQQGSGLIRRFFDGWDRLYARIETGYARYLKVALDRRWIVVVTGIVLFALAGFLSKWIGSEMVTEADQSQVTVTIELAPGTNLEETLRAVKGIETTLQAMPEVLYTLSTVGKIEGMLGKNTEGVHVAEILLLLVPKDQRDKDIKQFLKAVRDALAGVPAANIVVLQPSGIGGVEAPIQLEIRGPDLKKLEEFSETIINAAVNTSGAVAVDSTWRSGKPEIRILPDRRKLADHNFPVSAFGMVMRSYLEGTVAGTFREQDEEYDIRVKLREEDRKNEDAVANMLINLPGGYALPVAHLAEVVQLEGPTQILRKDKQRMIVVSMDASGRSIGEVAADLDEKIATMHLPSGYRIAQAGRIEKMNESFTDILIAFGLAIILTYLVLAAILESYLQPFSILLTVPLSLIGVWFSLFVTGETFNIFSMMAVVMLVGIVVNNAILIIDYTVVLLKQGQARKEALLQAATARLRPILMTTLAAAFAMLPLALAWGWGAEMRASMAIASIGGLLSSAAMTLFVVPVMYTFLEDLKQMVIRS